MKRWCVLSCRRSKNKGYSVFRAPQKPGFLRQKWIDFAQHENSIHIEENQQFFVCELHFKAKDLLRFPHRKQLLKDAVPIVSNSCEGKREDFFEDLESEYSVVRPESDEGELLEVKEEPQEMEILSYDKNQVYLESMQRSESQFSDSNSPSNQYESDGSEESAANSHSIKVKTPMQINQVMVNRVVKIYSKKPGEDPLTPSSSSHRLRKKIVPLRVDEVIEEHNNVDNQPLRITSSVSQHPSAQVSQQQQSKQALLTKFQLKNIALESENRKLKEMISTFAKEANDIQETLRKWTESFNVMLKTEQEKKEPEEPVKKSSPMKRVLYDARIPPPAKKPRILPTAPLHPVNKTPEIKPAAIRVVAPVTQLNKNITIKLNPQSKPDPPLVIPNFPLTSIRSFIQLEKDLKNHNFFKCVFEMLRINHKFQPDSDTKCQEAATVLLTEIVVRDLFKYFVWRCLPAGLKRLKMTDFPQFMSLYLSLALKLYAYRWPEPIMQPIVKQVLRAYIAYAQSQAKIQKLPPGESSEKKMGEFVVLNYDLNRKREESESPPESPKEAEEEEENNTTLNEDDLEKYFTTQTVLEPTSENEDEENSAEAGRTLIVEEEGEPEDEEGESDIEDITPAPVSIEIADDSD